MEEERRTRQSLSDCFPPPQFKWAKITCKNKGWGAVQDSAPFAYGPSMETQGWMEESCSAAPRPHSKTAICGRCSRLAPALTQVLLVLQRPEQQAERLFKMLLTVWGLCPVHRAVETQRLPRQENKPRGTRRTSTCRHVPVLSQATQWEVLIFTMQALRS